MYINSGTDTDPGITIRYAHPVDADSLRRLAERDSAPLPTGCILVAVSGNEIRAAISTQGEVIADPFHRTDAIVTLLRERMRQLHGERRGLRGRLAVFGRRSRGFSPQPAGTLRAFE